MQCSLSRKITLSRISNSIKSKLPVLQYLRLCWVWVHKEDKIIPGSEKVIYIHSVGRPFEMQLQETQAEKGETEYFISFL